MGATRCRCASMIAPAHWASQRRRLDQLCCSIGSTWLSCDMESASLLYGLECPGKFPMHGYLLFSVGVFGGAAGWSLFLKRLGGYDCPQMDQYWQWHVGSRCAVGKCYVQK